MPGKGSETEPGRENGRGNRDWADPLSVETAMLATLIRRRLRAQNMACPAPFRPRIVSRKQKRRNRDNLHSSMRSVRRHRKGDWWLFSRWLFALVPVGPKPTRAAALAASREPFAPCHLLPIAEKTHPRAVLSMPIPSPSPAKLTQ